MPLSSYEYSGTNIPAFLTKLWTLVEDKKYDELIAWDPVNPFFSSPLTLLMHPIINHLDRL